ncbi:hypothetical protein M9H77_09041 [Catharanthus roseus]|uniref:Uncharacterized protein n=1 Tax=Catharanthus roseus TaxID=4058 RepID=A0ACC0BZI5_CATRO|nr:hypothetical protein M9H77_09041 [Catharanthus roseus]
MSYQVAGNQSNPILQFFAADSTSKFDQAALDSGQHLVPESVQILMPAACQAWKLPNNPIVLLCQSAVILHMNMNKILPLMLASNCNVLPLIQDVYSGPDSEQVFHLDSVHIFATDSAPKFDQAALDSGLYLAAELVVCKMDRSWISEKDTFSNVYRTGVQPFLEFAKVNILKSENKTILSMSIMQKYKPKDYSRKLSTKELDATYRFILNNCDELESYKSAHKEELRKANCENVYLRHQEEFPSWFNKHINQIYDDGGKLSTCGGTSNGGFNKTLMPTSNARYNRPLQYGSLLASGVGVIIKGHAPLKDMHNYNDFPQSEKDKLYGDAWESVCDRIESLEFKNPSHIQHFGVTHKKTTGRVVRKEEATLAETLNKRPGYVIGMGYKVLPPKTAKGASSVGSSSDNATRLTEQLDIANETLQSQQVELAAKKKLVARLMQRPVFCDHKTSDVEGRKF